MVIINDNNYYVVEFTELPYPNIQKYVVVPNSWVRLRAPEEGTVFVAYPVENPSETEERVQNTESFNEDWKLYLATIRYDNDKFDNAKDWTTTMDDTDDIEYGRLEIVETENIDSDNDPESVTIDNNNVQDRHQNTETTGDLLASATQRETRSPVRDTSSDSNINKPQMIVEPLINNLNDSVKLLLKQTIQSDHENEVHKHMSIDARANEKQFLSVASNCDYQEQGAPDMDVETCLLENVIGLRGSPHSNTDSISTSTNSQNKSSPQPEQTKQRITVVSDEYLIQDISRSSRSHNNRAILGSSTHTVNSNDESTYSENIQHNTSAMEALRVLMNRQSQFLQRVQDNSNFMANTNLLHEKPREEETLNKRSNKGNYIHQKPRPQRVTKDTPPQQNSRNINYRSRRTTKRSHDKQTPTSYRDYLQQPSHSNKVTIAESTPFTSVDQTLPAQNIKQNTTPEKLKASNVINQSWELPTQMDQELYPTSFNIQVQQDSNINKIIITRNDDVNFVNQTAPPQNITENTSRTVHKPLNVPNEPCQMSNCLPQQQFQPQIIVRTTIGAEPINLQDFNESSTKNTPSVLHNFPNLEIQTSQSGRPSSDNNGSSLLLSYLKQVPRTPKIRPRKPFAADQKTPLKGITKIKQPAVQKPPNKRSQISHRPIVKGYLLQDPCTGELFYKKSDVLNAHDQRASHQDTSINTPPVVHNRITSINQTSQYSEHFNGKPLVPIAGNYAIQDRRLQENNLGRHANMDSLLQASYPQNVPQNAPAVIQSSSNLIHNSCCSCKCSCNKQVSLLPLQHPYQDPRTENTHSGRSNMKSCLKPNCTCEINTENRSFAVKNSQNTANPLFVYSREKQLLSNHADCPCKLSCTQNMSGRTYINKNRDEQSVSSVSPMEYIEPPIQNFQHIPYQSYPSPKEEQLPIYVDSSDEETYTREKPVKKLKATNHAGEIINLEHNKERRSTTIQSLPTADNKPLDSRAMAEQILMDEFKALFKNMDSTTSSNTSGMLDNMRNTFVTFKKVIDRINTYCESKTEELKTGNEIPTSTSKDMKVIVKKLKQTNTKNKSNYIDAEDDLGDKVSKVPKKEREHKLPFVLPPEYDPNDTRWTLKYREPTPETVELIPHSRVYVNSIKFAHYKQTAKDCRTLARLLLTEIFSLKALSVCSLTGARAKAFDRDGSKVRPGLDEHARMVLQTFIEQYGMKKSWTVFDIQSINNSIRGKIQELRHKYG